MPLTNSFTAGADGFSYLDDLFRGTTAPAYASGGYTATGGFSGGGLRVLLGGIDNSGVLGMSGGWGTSFSLSAPADVTLTLRYQLTQGANYESDEYSEALMSVDGDLRGLGGTDRLARLAGDGNGGSNQTTGWQLVALTLPGLAAGTHTVVIGGYNNKKTASDETTEILIDDVAITADAGVTANQTGTGDFTIATATTGESQPAGYTMNVTAPDGTPFTLTFAATESKPFPGVAAGDYRLEITDMPANCALTSGTNPRTVTVPDGGTASTTFGITCTATTPTTGTLSITTATTGAGAPAGYTLTVTGPSFPAGASTTLGPNASETVTVNAGDYTVGLSNVPANCTVSTAQGANPRTVTVSGGGTGSTAFNVTCASTSGTLAITTATTGAGAPAGYTLTVTGPSFPAGASTTIGPNANETVTVNAGDYMVGLSNVPANCTVSTAQGPNPRTVTVTGGGTSTSTFNVSCTAPSGNLTVTAATTGSELDADGYTVTVSGAAGTASQAVAVNGSVTFSAIPAGDYQVSLSGVAGNCTVSGANPRTVTVVGGGTGSTTFSLSCTTTAGNLIATTSTSGSSLDPDGYTVTVNGGNARAISINGSVTYTGVPAGSYTVALSGVASNCSVSGGSSRTVTVSGGATATVSYSVSCTATSGSLKVTTATSGSSLDPDGYTVTVNGGNARAISINGSVTYTGVPAGSYTVALSGVASNCSVSGGTSRTVTVPAGGTVTVAYSVTCTTPNQAPTVNAGSK